MEQEQNKVDIEKRNLLKKAGLISLGVGLIALIPEKVDALIFGKHPYKATNGGTTSTSTDVTYLWFQL